MKKIFITLTSMLLASCTFFESDHDDYWVNQVRPYKTVPIHFYDQADAETEEKIVNSQTINTHSYKHNVVVSANLGQRMVDAQTYTVQNFVKPELVATSSGRISAGANSIAINEGQLFTATGEVKMNGVYFLLVPANDEGNFFLIDEDGKFLPIISSIYHGDLLIPREKAVIFPRGLKIEQRKTSRETSSDPKLQFEIKYDGLENGNMSFIYTDYSNATSTEGYFQRFTFPKEQDLVNLNGVKFKVMDVYPDRIEYMLLD